jgi:hypothetical protein
VATTLNKLIDFRIVSVQFEASLRLSDLSGRKSGTEFKLDLGARKGSFISVEYWLEYDCGE